MQFAELFYSVFWVSCLSVIWFYTDTVLYYCNLFGVYENLMNEYKSFIKEQPQKYFPDFLYIKFSNGESKLLRFATKLTGCVLCLSFWLAACICLLQGNWILIAPTYVISLAITLKIKNLI